MEYKLLVYKKAKNCPSCRTLDLLTPKIKEKYPEVEWDYVVVSGDENNPDDPILPEFVKSFPTSVLFKDGEEVLTIRGYESLAKELHGQLR